MGYDENSSRHGERERERERENLCPWEAVDAGYDETVGSCAHGEMERERERAQYTWIVCDRALYMECVCVLWEYERERERERERDQGSVPLILIGFHGEHF